MSNDIDIAAISQRVHESLVPDFRSYCIATVEELSVLCESPIEVMLGAAIIVGFNLSNQNIIGLPKSNASLILEPQYQWENYRIDFSLSARKHPEAKARLFIECDGHDFHERTKEQAARDRKKDRKIQEAAMHVLRFTGSEIYRDPKGCAEQVMTFLNKNSARLFL